MLSFTQTLACTLSSSDSTRDDPFMSHRRRPSSTDASSSLIFDLSCFVLNIALRLQAKRLMMILTSRSFSQSLFKADEDFNPEKSVSDMSDRLWLVGGFLTSALHHRVFWLCVQGFVFRSLWCLLQFRPAFYHYNTDERLSIVFYAAGNCSSLGVHCSTWAAP